MINHDKILHKMVDDFNRQVRELADSYLKNMSSTFTSSSIVTNATFQFPTEEYRMNDDMMNYYEVHLNSIAEVQDEFISNFQETLFQSTSEADTDEARKIYQSGIDPSEYCRQVWYETGEYFSDYSKFNKNIDKIITRLILINMLKNK